MTVITENNYVSDGVTVLYSVTFNYIDESDVQVSYDGTETTAFSFDNATTIRLSTAPSTGVVIRVFRRTDVDELPTTFYPGSTIQASDLNDNFNVSLYVAQEAARDSASAGEALPTAVRAETKADAAVVEAGAATTTAQTANNAALNAQIDASAAVSSAADATTTANAAVVTANGAESTANAAAALVASVSLPTTVANVAAIPASPADIDLVEVQNSTGIESFSPLTGTPAGFVGDSGIAVKIVYDATGVTWQFLEYRPIDPDARYATEADATAIAQAEVGTLATDVVTAQNAANSAQTTADGALQRSGGAMFGPITFAAGQSFGISTATNTVEGTVRLTNAIASSSSMNDGYAATPDAVKAAYDRGTTAINTANNAASTASSASSAAATAQATADGALQRSGGTMTGQITFAAGQSFGFSTATSTVEGAVRLTNSTNSLANTGSGYAATPLAVKTAYDRGTTAINTADNAASTASSALSTANAAQTTADAAQSTADAAQTTASGVSATANAAQTTANTAFTTASTAETRANAAQSTADAAQITASGASATANAAQTTANTAGSRAHTAEARANAAQLTADTAQTAANAAQTTADAAQSTADAALTSGDTRNINELYTGDWAEAFNDAGKIGGLWWVPNGNYAINSPIIIEKDGTKFSADPTDKPKLTFNFRAGTVDANNITSNNRFGMWCAAKTRVRGLYFEWHDDYINLNNDSALLLFQKGDTSNGQRDDMDSSVDACTFSNARHDMSVLGAADITYYGRNMRVTGCTFSSGSGDGHVRAIALSYTPNADDVKEGQTLATAGHRRNFVTGNTFHMTKKSICVEVFKGASVATGAIVGLMITSNINDVGGSLLRVNNGVYADATVVTGNSCIRSSLTPYIDVLSGGKLRNSTITGNTFGIADANDDNYADCITLQSGGEMRDVTITGNAMGAPETACINLIGTYARVIISSNSFSKEHGPGTLAIAGGTANNKAVVTSNIVDELTLTSGTTNNWAIANNLPSTGSATNVNPDVFNVREYMLENEVSSDDAISTAFAWAASNLSGSAPCIYFPAGVYTSTAKTLIASGSVDSKTQITIKGEGRGDSSQVELSDSWTINHPVNISGMFFVGGFNGSSLSFRRSDTGGGARQDDMDTSISNCVFNNWASIIKGSINTVGPPSFNGDNSGEIHVDSAGDGWAWDGSSWSNIGQIRSIDVDYRGRNLELYNCRFKTGGTNGVGIKLSYFNNIAEDNRMQDSLGWKRILIHGNVFHNYPTSVNIVAPTNFSSGEPRLRGLVFSNNAQETSGTFINATASNVIVEAAAITGNTCQVNQNGTALIAFRFNKFYYSSFTGNTVFGNPGQTRFARLLDTSDAKGCAITSNIVHMCDSAGGISGTMNGCRIAGNIGAAPSGSNIVVVTGTNSLASNQDLTLV